MKKISIKGRQFAYEVMGTGSPTVVLETGIGAESSEWGPVAAAIARSRAVFRYDGAGRGESDPGQGNRDALNMVGELNALLEATQTKGPYLLVQAIGLIRTGDATPYGYIILESA
jgi:pimeloyl-ACP methyl ester carboxylesterase